MKRKTLNLDALTDWENAETPSPNGGRNVRGQFSVGWKGGPGNPYASRVGELRAAMYSEATPLRIRRIIKRLMVMAEAGDLAAAKLILDRVMGRAPVDVLAFLNGAAMDETLSPEFKYL